MRVADREYPCSPARTLSAVVGVINGSSRGSAWRTLGRMAVRRVGDPAENAPNFVKSPKIRHLRPILSKLFRSMRRAVLDVLRAVIQAASHFRMRRITRRANTSIAANIRAK